MSEQYTLEQEVKQLKDDNKLLDFEVKKWFKEAYNNKQKLEKIEKLVERNDYNTGIIIKTELKEILESKLPLTISRPKRDEGGMESKK